MRRARARRSPALTRGACWAALLAALASPAGAEGRAAAVSGAVELSRGAPARWQPLAAGAALQPGDTVRTGRNGRAELDWDGAQIRLYPDSLLRLPGAGQGAGAELEGGRSLFDVTPGREVPFEVRSPEVIVSVKGTRFAVQLEDAGAEVDVFRGKVGVRGPAAGAAAEVLVREGFAAVGSARTPFELFLHMADDPWDAWRSGEALAPLPRRARLMGGPDRSAAAQAREAAEKSSREDALRQIARSHPELVQRIARSQAQAGGSEGAIRDGVADSRDALLRQQLREQSLERAAGIDISVVGSSVQITDALNNTYTLAAAELQQVLAGQAALPPALDAVLATQGIQNDSAFAANLLRLIPQP